MTDAIHPAPPPLPAEGRPKVPLITIVVLVMGLIAISSGVNVIRHDWTCSDPGCNQPLGLAVGMLVWGVIALLTAIRGRLGFIALIVVLVSPLAIGWFDPWFFLLGLVIFLNLAKGSKEHLAPYYRWKREEP